MLTDEEPPPDVARPGDARFGPRVGFRVRAVSLGLRDGYDRSVEPFSPVV